MNFGEGCKVFADWLVVFDAKNLVQPIGYLAVVGQQRNPESLLVPPLENDEVADEVVARSATIGLPIGLQKRIDEFFSFL